MRSAPDHARFHAIYVDMRFARLALTPEHGRTGWVVVSAGKRQVMLDQAVPVGINVNSPVTWFIVVVALVVLGLTLSTRRGNVRGRNVASTLPRVAPNRRAFADIRARYDRQWPAAQARFVDDPRAGCEQARSIVANALRDTGAEADRHGRDATVEECYREARAIADRPTASTDELRQAFIAFRATFDALIVDERA